MDKEFLNYEQSLALKKLGFDEPCCICTYTGDTGNNINRIIETLPSKAKNHNQDDLCVSMLLKQQAFRFFREKYNILVNVYANASGFLYQWEDAVGGTHRGFSDFEGLNDSGVWDSYEEAELACIDKLIELVKEVNNEQ